MTILDNRRHRNAAFGSAIVFTSLSVAMYLASTPTHYPLWFYNGLKGVVALTAISLLFVDRKKTFWTLFIAVGVCAYAGIFVLGKHRKAEWAPINLGACVFYGLSALIEWVSALSYKKEDLYDEFDEGT
jgi:hypothetical protein